MVASLSSLKMRIKIGWAPAERWERASPHQRYRAGALPVGPLSIPSPHQRYRAGAEGRDIEPGDPASVSIL